jgi:hypothetical protein
MINPAEDLRPPFDCLPERASHVSTLSVSGQIMDVRHNDFSGGIDFPEITVPAQPEVC